jgi:hypothetical protein
MSLGREYGERNREGSDFRDSWASPLIEWQFPQFADDESGGGAGNMFGESDIYGEDASAVNQENGTGEEDVEDEIQEPTMSYEEAASQYDKLRELIEEHLGPDVDES